MVWLLGEGVREDLPREIPSPSFYREGWGRGEERRFVTAYRRDHREPRLECGGIRGIEYPGVPGYDAPQDAPHRARN